MKIIILFAFVAYASCATPEQIPILKQDSDISPDGAFNYVYETGHGILAEARGVLKNAGNKETEASEITGSFEYKGDDGASYSVHYIANENGYQPQGAHLPVAPEVPAYIAKALDWIAAHPHKEEQLGKKF